MFITLMSLFLCSCEITVHRKLMASEVTVVRLLSKCISIVQFSNKSLMARADSGPQKDLRLGSGQVAEKAWTYRHRPYLEIWTNFTSHIYSTRIPLKYEKKKGGGAGRERNLPASLLTFSLFKLMETRKFSQICQRYSSTNFGVFFPSHN